MVKKKEEIVEEVVCDETCKPKVGLLAQEFGNGDLNVLRDKINEIINNL